MGENQVLILKAGPSQFGVNLIGTQKVQARTAVVEPFHACSELIMSRKSLEGKIALIERGECMFVDKVRRVQKHGAVGKFNFFAINKFRHPKLSRLLIGVLFCREQIKIFTGL